MRTIVTAFLSLITIASTNAQQTCPKWGPYVETTNFKNQTGVLVMSDVKFPANGIAPYTYASSINFKIGKSGGYCGIQKAGLNEKRKGNNIFSIWDFPNKIQITAPYKDRETFVGGFGGEGTGLHSHSDFGWIPDHWYTNIVRCWTVNDSTTLVGYWLYDHSANTWKHYVTFEVPEAHAKLQGNIGSFLENFADDAKRTRLGDYRDYWMLKEDGAWLHPDTLVAKAGKGSWKAEKVGDAGVRLTSCGTNIGLDQYKFKVVMPDKPVFVKSPTVFDLAGYYDKSGKIVHVDWSVAPEDMPQLSYKVALYNNAECTGTPLAAASGTDPDRTMVGLAVNGIELKNQNYYITLQLTDIFNQVSSVKIFELHDLKP
jgi:hypothetical protein